MIKINLWLFFLAFALQVNAQFIEPDSYLELGLTTAATNYSGDLAEKQVILKQTRLGFGAFARYHLNRFLLVRGQIFTGKLFGDDKNSPNHAGRQFRFSSQLLETTLLLEGNLAALKIDAVASANSYYFFPYLFAGVGATYSNPKVNYYGPATDLEQFVREPIPEGGKSGKTLLSTPFGLGLRMIYGERFCMGLEAGVRPVYSDLLDGVSKNGNPDQGDWYYTAGLTLSYFINRPWHPTRWGI